MSCRLLIVFLALGLLVTGCTVEEAEEKPSAAGPDLMTYRDEDKGFSIEVPKSWGVVQPGEKPPEGLEAISLPENARLVALSPERADSVEAGELAALAPALVVQVNPTARELDFEEFERATTQAVRASADEETFESQVVALPPGEAVEYTYERAAEGGVRSGVRQYALLVDGKQYVLSFQTEADRLHGDTDLFEQIADTFKVD